MLIAFLGAATVDASRCKMKKDAIFVGKNLPMDPTWGNDDIEDCIKTCVEEGGLVVHGQRCQYVHFDPNGGKCNFLSQLKGENPVPGHNSAHCSLEYDEGPPGRSYHISRPLGEWIEYDPARSNSKRNSQHEYDHEPPHRRGHSDGGEFGGEGPRGPLGFPDHGFHHAANQRDTERNPPPGSNAAQGWTDPPSGGNGSKGWAEFGLGLADFIKRASDDYQGGGRGTSDHFLRHDPGFYPPSGYDSRTSDPSYRPPANTPPYGPPGTSPYGPPDANPYSPPPATNPYGPPVTNPYGPPPANRPYGGPPDYSYGVPPEYSYGGPPDYSYGGSPDAGYPQPPSPGYKPSPPRPDVFNGSHTGRWGPSVPSTGGGAGPYAPHSPHPHAPQSGPFPPPPGRGGGLGGGVGGVGGSEGPPPPPPPTGMFDDLWSNGRVHRVDNHLP